MLLFFYAVFVVVVIVERVKIFGKGTYIFPKIFHNFHWCSFFCCCCCCCCCCFCPSGRPSVRPSIHLFVHSSVRPYVTAFVKFNEMTFLNEMKHREEWRRERSAKEEGATRRKGQQGGKSDLEEGATRRKEQRGGRSDDESEKTEKMEKKEEWKSQLYWWCVKILDAELKPSIQKIWVLWPIGSFGEPQGPGGKSSPWGVPWYLCDIPWF